VSAIRAVHLVFQAHVPLPIKTYLFNIDSSARDKTLAQGSVLLERSGDYYPCRGHDLLFLNGRNRFRKAFGLGRQDALCISPQSVTTN